MPKPYLLYWLRENGCDSGTPAGLEDLDAPIRERVAALTADNDESVPLHLPFLDTREWRVRSRVLQTLDFVRDAGVIRGVWASQLAPLRETAAWLNAVHPSWIEAPRENDRHYFRTWQRVSVALQTSLRTWIREAYFADPTHYEDRDAAYSMLVYSVSRSCFGRPNTEFTFDSADERTLPTALRMIGCATQAALKCAEAQLIECGMTIQARRYAPVWYQDVINSVKKKPERLVGLIGDEGMLINAVIQLGARENLSGVKPFARAASLAMRSILGIDMRSLAFRALEETTSLLTKFSDARARAISRSRREESRRSFSEQGTSGRCTLDNAASR